MAPDCAVPNDVHFHRNCSAELEILIDSAGHAPVEVVVNGVYVVVIGTLSDFESVVIDLDRRANVIYLFVDISMLQVTEIATNGQVICGMQLANVEVKFPVFA